MTQYSKGQSVSQNITHLAIRQWVSQLASQTAFYSVSKASQIISQSVCNILSINCMSVIQSVNESVSMSVSQSINKSVQISKSVNNKSAILSVNKSVNQQESESISWLIHQQQLYILRDKAIIIYNTCTYSTEDKSKILALEGMIHLIWNEKSANNNLDLLHKRHY